MDNRETRTATAATGSQNHLILPVPGLLRLTRQTRRRIYLYLGLASWDGRPYTFDLHEGQVWSSWPPLPFHAIFTNLLRSCRTINAEATALLYSANQFILYYSHPGSLEPLRTLTAPSLASLARLKIILNQASCHEPTAHDDCRGCCNNWRPSTCDVVHTGKHRPPLFCPASDNHNKSAAQTMLDEWRSTVVYLSSHLTSEHVELSLVCDVDPEHGVEAAKLAVAPLRFLPALKDCHIRLCKRPDAQLQQVAHEAVLQARRILTPYTKPRSTATKLITLPRELRLRILEFTDLITPSREVTWSRHDSGYVVHQAVCSKPGFSDCEPSIHYMCQFNQCWWTTNRTPSLGCFCRVEHAAFTSTCKCWVPPGPALFLVCRVLRQDAEFVFFSSNRFIVHDYKSNRPYLVPDAPEEPITPDLTENGHYPYKRFAASQFLKEVVPTHCLPYLRFLELGFPPYTAETWPQNGHAATQGWLGTIEWARDKINAPGLTVRLAMGDVFDLAGECDVRVNRIFMSAHQARHVHAAYSRILRSLRILVADGLARFYAQLADPLAHTEETTRYRKTLDLEIGEFGWGSSYNWELTRSKRRKDSAERYVLGDRYETQYSNNKEEPERSLWQFVFERR